MEALRQGTPERPDVVRPELGAKEVRQAEETDGPAQGVDVNDGDGGLRRTTADRVRVGEIAFQVAGEIGKTDHLDGDTGHEGLSAADHIDQDQRCEDATDEFGQTIETARVDLGTRPFEPDQAEDGRQVVGDGVGAGHLGQDVGDDGQLDATKVGTDAEGLLEDRPEGVLAILHVFVGDLGQDVGVFGLE